MPSITSRIINWLYGDTIRGMIYAYAAANSNKFEEIGDTKEQTEEVANSIMESLGWQTKMFKDSTTEAIGYMLERYSIAKKRVPNPDSNQDENSNSNQVVEHIVFGRFKYINQVKAINSPHQDSIKIQKEYKNAVQGKKIFTLYKKRVLVKDLWDENLVQFRSEKYEVKEQTGDPTLDKVVELYVNHLNEPL